MPSYGEILDLLIRVSSLSTKEVANKLGCTPKHLWPQLKHLQFTGFLEKDIAKRPVISHGKTPVKWSITKSFRRKFREGGYKTIYDMPWIKAIEEKRKAHMGWCQICKKNHPYPHKQYPKRR